MNYGFFPDKPSFFEGVAKAAEQTPSWRPQEMCHRVLVLGPPRSMRVTGRDGKERLQAELLIEADGELCLWKFGMSVFQQLKGIEEEVGLDNVWLEVRKNTQGRFPQIEVLYSAQRVD